MEKARVILILLLCFVSGLSQAQESIVSSVDRNPVALNEQFRLSFKLSGQPKEFSPPDLSNFILLSGPNSSSSVSIINGQMSQEFTYTYTLMPKSEGVFAISPAKAVISGKKVESKEIRMRVQGEIQRKADPNDPQALLKSKVFYRAVVSKRELYRGESLILTYKLYYGLDVVQLGFEDVPTFEGFWSKEIPQPSNPSPKSEIYKGERFNVAILKQYLLIPQKNDELQIKPFSLETVVRVPTNQVDFFGRRRMTTMKHLVRTNPVTISVKALPEPRPSDFSGAVGSFNLQSELDPRELRTDESATLVYTISGEGNLNLFEIPRPQLPPDIESYEPKLNENVSINAGGVKGSKRYEYLLVPRYGGEYVVPGYSLSYFDPSEKVYKKLRAPEFSLVIEGESNESIGRAGKSSLPNTGESRDLNYLGEDILYLNTNAGDILLHSKKYFGSPAFFGIGALALFGFFGLVLIGRRREKQLANDQIWREKKASKRIRRALKQAESLNSKSLDSQALQALENGIYDFLSDKFGKRKADMNRQSIRHLIVERTDNEELAGDLAAILDSCDSNKYAGVSLNVGDLISRSKEVLSSLEKSTSQ